MCFQSRCETSLGRSLTLSGPHGRDVCLFGWRRRLGCLRYTDRLTCHICGPLGYERVCLPLCKVADTPFHIQSQDLGRLIVRVRVSVEMNKIQDTEYFRFFIFINVPLTISLLLHYCSIICKNAFRKKWWVYNHKQEHTDNRPPSLLNLSENSITYRIIYYNINLIFYVSDVSTFSIGSLSSLIWRNWARIPAGVDAGRLGCENTAPLNAQRCGMCSAAYRSLQ